MHLLLKRTLSTRETEVKKAMLNKLNLQKGVFHADADAAFDAEEIRRGVKIKIKQTAIELT